jgi:hydroxypyruvate reductase
MLRNIFRKSRKSEIISLEDAERIVSERRQSTNHPTTIMQRTSGELRRDAMRIWTAGVEAVKPQRLIEEHLQVDGDLLRIGDEEIDLRSVRRIAVVGAGKAGAGMAVAVEKILGQNLAREKQLAGWVNVPEDCVRPMEFIRLHAARPAGVNEPRPEGVAGAMEILRIVESLGPDDLCLCLLSGGGSALMPAPAEGVALEDKLAVIRHLSAAGANIEQLNAVRKRLSRVKGGGLARACRTGLLVSLIISDVPGDRIEAIASGPTVGDSAGPDAALKVLDEFHALQAGISPGLYLRLRNEVAQWNRNKETASEEPSGGGRVINLIVGNNASTVDAAGVTAERLGYSHAMASASQPEGYAEDVGRHLADMALRMRAGPGPNCLISGGEPVVRLVESHRRGCGGRNQQLVLAALERLAEDGAKGIAILSGGTDGEDGPSDAAGAVLNEQILAAVRERRLDPRDFLSRNDAYHFFAPLGALLKTGPTNTNVCDLRVVVVDRD